MSLTSTDIIDFWYSPTMQQAWFKSTPEIDAMIRESYLPIWEQAAKGELDEWKNSAEGCLALCIIMDQFPRNMFRGDVRTYSTGQQAVKVTKHALSQGFHEILLAQERANFLYMPLLHSEELADQDLSVKLFHEGGEALAMNARYSLHHRDIVQRFGRFPHRNAILGRESSDEELAYLNSPEAFTG